MPAINTRFLTAGHGPRRPRRPLTVAQTAQRIVESINRHAAVGMIRTPEEYTNNPATLAAVQALLKGEQ